MTDLTRWFDNRLSPIEMLERLFERPERDQPSSSAHKIPIARE